MDLNHSYSDTRTESNSWCLSSHHWIVFVLECIKITHGSNWPVHKDQPGLCFHGHVPIIGVFSSGENTSVSIVSQARPNHPQRRSLSVQNTGKDLVMLGRFPCAIKVMWPQPIRLPMWQSRHSIQKPTKSHQTLPSLCMILKVILLWLVASCCET